MKPQRELLFWNGMGAMMKKWLGWKIPKARAFSLLRLWLGYDFTFLMDGSGCFPVSSLNTVRKLMQYETVGKVIEDMQRSQSFYLFADKDGKLVKFCSPIWHEPVTGDGKLMPYSYVDHSSMKGADAKGSQDGVSKTVRNSDPSVNENTNDNPLKENEKEKSPFTDQWAEGFRQHYPVLAQMAHPLTENEYQKLLAGGYSNERITAKLTRMENYPRVLKKYSSVYLTLLDWLRG